MLVDRQQFDMGEAKVGDIGNQLGRQFVIGEESPVRSPRPGRQMHLIYRHRRAARFLAPAPIHIFAVGPGKERVLDDDRRGRGAQFAGTAERIRLQRRQRAIGAHDLIFVARPSADAGNEYFPYPAVDALAHLARAAHPID